MPYKDKNEEKQNRKLYALLNREKLAEYQRLYRIKNLNKLKKYHKKYRLKNEQEIKKNKSEYYKLHKEEIFSKSKKWKKNNPKKVKQSAKKYREKHRDYLKEKTHQRRGAIIKNSINSKTLLKMYDYKCAHCNKEININNFNIDHLLPISRFIKIGKKCPHDYNNCVPSCAKCNLQKKSMTPIEFYFHRSF